MRMRCARRRSHATRIATLVAVGLVFAGPVTAQVDLPSGFVHETIVGGLDDPNSLAFLPDGRLLFTEQRTGSVRMIVNGHIASRDPALHVSSVSAGETERGLQGIAVDPRWPLKPYLYVCFTRTGDEEWLVRYTGTGDLSNPSGENLSFGSPLILIDDIRDVNDNHNGGTLRFGTDDRLYLSLGEDAERCRAQRIGELAGKILRLDVSRLPATGTGPVPRALLIPPDNPISSSDSNARLVYASGLRNPWRFHVDPQTGVLYVGDVGESNFEEVDEVYPGDNLGWPFREAFSTLVPADCSESGGAGNATYTGPIASLNHNDDYYAILTAGVYRPRGTLGDWPATYLGNVFFCDYYSGKIRRLRKSGGNWVPGAAVPGQPNPTDWANGFFSAADFQFGADQSLWYARQFNDNEVSGTGSIGRIRSTAGPVAVEPQSDGLAFSAAPNPFRGEVTFTVSLAERGTADLSVYDVTGREVRRLAESNAGPGIVRLAWDGRDHQREPVPPGVYLARLSHLGNTCMKRVFRVR